MPLPIIDTHVHVWDFDHAEYEWLNGDTSILNRTYKIEELSAIRAEAGVSHGVLVQAANNFEDTDWMLHVSSTTDWISGVVGWVPLVDPHHAGRALEKYMQNPYFKGIRHLIHNEADDQWLLQHTVVESLQLLEHYGLPYDVVGINTRHIETALKVAEKVPGLKMVFDHLNQPPIAAKQLYGEWGEMMAVAAQHPNFYAKISGLCTASGNFTGWTKDDLAPYINFALQHFGAHRCFCGGDWPVSLLAGSYTHTWHAYQDILSNLLSEDELRKVYFDNAKDFYRI
ncbi:amidohydrolase family protein [Aridibaculum aurantiacum]|uniref:amidohydrolase family protein n=1 Tax=Aridibaculum aurantiacum TaxID=2810307 RepID=UPI001A962AF1|nr:amidohydrolase family protein [Aridibaculum aurantiacum]